MNAIYDAEEAIMTAMLEQLQALEAGGPDWRIKPAKVKLGIDEGDISGTTRPLYAMMVADDNDEPKTMGKRHDVTLEGGIYVLSGRTSDAEGFLRKVVADLRELFDQLLEGGLQTKVGTAATIVAAPRLYHSTRLVDPGAPDPGTAWLQFRLAYRIAHT